MYGLWGSRVARVSEGLRGLVGFKSTFGFDLIKKICPYNPKYIRFHVKSPNKDPGFLNQLPLLGSRVVGLALPGGPETYGLWGLPVLNDQLFI